MASQLFAYLRRLSPPPSPIRSSLVQKSPLAIYQFFLSLASELRTSNAFASYHPATTIRKHISLRFFPERRGGEPPVAESEPSQAAVAAFDSDPATVRLRPGGRPHLRRGRRLLPVLPASGHRQGSPRGGPHAAGARSRCQQEAGEGPRISGAGAGGLGLRLR